jgi:hypothetical protein
MKHDVCESMHGMLFTQQKIQELRPQLRQQQVNLDKSILREQFIDNALVELCGRGSSFVPTPMNVDWNDIQQGYS